MQLTFTEVVQQPLWEEIIRQVKSLAKMHMHNPIHWSTFPDMPAVMLVVCVQPSALHAFSHLRHSSALSCDAPELGVQVPAKQHRDSRHVHRVQGGDTGRSGQVQPGLPPQLQAC